MSAVVVGGVRADEDVVEAVAIDIARRAKAAAAEPVVLRRALDAEACVAVEAAEVDHRREAGGFAEHHIGRTRVTGADPVEKIGANQDVGEAIAIHIARRH